MAIMIIWLGEKLIKEDLEMCEMETKKYSFSHLSKSVESSVPIPLTKVDKSTKLKKLISLPKLK
jgi:hypothetical protein